MQDAGTIKNSANAESSPANASPAASSRAISSPAALSSAGSSPAPATPIEPANSRWKKRVTLLSLLIVVIAAAAVLPPLINLGRYQRQVTTVVSRSLGRPVQLSSVGLRLLPRPGFILHDLSVAEDPRFGVEPVISARTVITPIALASLWKGKLALDRVSVDEASLNLVQTPEGHWNIESLMIGAQPALTQGVPQANPKASPQARPASTPAAPAKAIAFPYLEATNSRVNIKHGTEKSPFSLVNTDLSLWQENPGQWRVRLRGQPVRTDMEMSWADTGEVRMEASLHAAPQLRDMPFKLQMEWRDAHLGQLSRLVLGSDAGWRGDLTADIEVEGTAESAQTKARLQAASVRREEFAPETPLDLDANCSFRYQHSQRAIHNLACDTALGSGQLHLKAELPGTSGAPNAMLEVSKVPLQAALDLLRTVRGGFAPGITANGTADGSLTYQQVSQVSPQPPAHRGKRSPAGKTPKPLELNKTPMSAQNSSGNWQGMLTVSGGILKGGQLKEPLILPMLTWAPALAGGLETRFTVALPAPKAAAPLPESPTPTSTPTSTPTAQAFTLRLKVNGGGYDGALTGSAATGPLRALAYAFGLPHSDSLDSFSGGVANLDLSAFGPWVSAFEAAPTASPDPDPALNLTPALALTTTGDAITGTLTLRHTMWKPAYLPQPVDLPLVSAAVQGTSVALTSDFTYPAPQPAPSSEASPASAVPSPAPFGPVPSSPVPSSPVSSGPAQPATNLLQGTVTIQTAPSCQDPDCAPVIHLRFGALDAAQVQAAILGDSNQKSPSRPLMDRVRDRIGTSEKPTWPPMTLQLDADSLALGAVTLRKLSAQLLVRSYGDLELKSWTTSLLGGSATGTGSLLWTSSQPEYDFEGVYTDLNAASAGTLAGAHWSGKPIHGKGQIKLSGLDWKQLESSAVGELQFVWPGGVISTNLPLRFENPALHFENWTGTLAVKAGKAQLVDNTMTAGQTNLSISGTIPLGGAAKLSIASPGIANSSIASPGMANPVDQAARKPNPPQPH